MELKIKKETAKKRYDESPEWFKEILVETFGEETFKPKHFTNIKTFEDARMELGDKTWKYQGIVETVDEYAYRQIKLIVKAINQGWTPDWSSTDQRKWYPWFDVSPSALGFMYSGYSYTNTYMAVCSCLCFETSEKAEYAGKQFIDIYQQFLL